MLLHYDGARFTRVDVPPAARDVNLYKVTGDGARVAAAPPDAVVCDLRMPDGDGLAVLRALRGQSRTAPFILMTA